MKTGIPYLYWSLFKFVVELFHINKGYTCTKKMWILRSLSVANCFRKLSMTFSEKKKDKNKDKFSKIASNCSVGSINTYIKALKKKLIRRSSITFACVNPLCKCEYRDWHYCEKVAMSFVVIISPAPHLISGTLLKSYTEIKNVCLITILRNQSTWNKIPATWKWYFFITVLTQDTIFSFITVLTQDTVFSLTRM